MIRKGLEVIQVSQDILDGFRGRRGIGTFVVDDKGVHVEAQAYESPLTWKIASAGLEMAGRRNCAHLALYRSVLDGLRETLLDEVPELVSAVVSTASQRTFMSRRLLQPTLLT
jgi:hypothetical protein